MKLNDAWLCVQTDCNTIFSPKEQLFPFTNLLMCPVCGNKNLLNLGRVLNRQEETENEDPIKRIPGVGSIDARRYGVNYAVKSRRTGEVFKTLRSNSSEDDLLRVSKIPGNLSSLCCPENKSGTRLCGGIDLLGK